MSVVQDKIINRIRIKLGNNAQRDPVDLTSKLFDKITPSVALEDYALICTNWKYSEQTFKSQLLTHSNMVEMFFNYYRFRNVVLNDAVPMSADETENEVMTHNVKIMLDVLFPISFPGIKSVGQKSKGSNINVLTLVQKAIFGKNENTYLKIGGKTQTVDNVIWMDLFASNPTYVKARELTSNYFETYLPKAVARLATLYNEALGKLGTQTETDTKNALTKLLSKTKDNVSDAEVKRLEDKLEDFNELQRLSNALKNFKGITTGGPLLKNVPTILHTYATTNSLIWTDSTINGQTLINKVSNTPDTDTLVTGQDQSRLNTVKLVLKNLKDFYTITKKHPSEKVNLEKDNIEDEIEKVNEEIRKANKNSKTDKLTDINDNNLTTKENRQRLIAANPEFTTLFANYDKAVLKNNNAVSVNPFSNTEFKKNIDNAKTNYDNLKTTYDNLPEFKALQKIINIGYLLTRVYHYKKVSAAKSELGVNSEDLNRPEFVFYDTLVEGFRDFYFPNRQYMNSHINKVFVENDEVDIFDLQRLFKGVKPHMLEPKSDSKPEPEGIDRINYLSKSSSDPRYEITLQLNVFGGVITKDNSDAVFSFLRNTKSDKYKCLYGSKDLVAKIEQYQYNLPVQTYFDLTPEIDKINKEFETNNNKEKSKSNAKNQQQQQPKQQQTNIKPTDNPVAQVQVAAPAAQTQAAVPVKEGIPTISDTDYENEINRLYTAVGKTPAFAGTTADILKALQDNKSNDIKKYFSLVKYLETRPPSEMAPGQKNMTNRDYYRKLSNDAKETVDNALKSIDLKLNSDTAINMPVENKTKLLFNQALFGVVKKMLDISFQEMNKKLGLEKKGGKRVSRRRRRNSRYSRNRRINRTQRRFK